MALASLAMRHVLVDRAKARLRRKREGSGRAVTLDEHLLSDAHQPETLIQISDALERLAAEDPRLAHIVDCRFFGGFSEPEIAEALGVTVRTVQRDWVKARALLRMALDVEAEQ
jgi:RNA polymerase sigma factor (TIGR02999 family)